MRPCRAIERLPVMVFLVALLCLPEPGASVSDLPPFPIGMPPHHLTPPAPEFEFRFHSVAQAPDGLLFVGGQDGVYSYDGRRWEATPTPNRHLVRTLRHDGDQRLYVGGYGMFGFVELDANGEPQLTDLTPDLNQVSDATNFADVWDILITDDAVFFRALFHVFRYKRGNGVVDYWHYPGRFGAIVEYQNEVLLQFRGEGLRRLDGDRWQPVAGSEPLSTHMPGLLPLPEGGLLTVARDGQWRRFYQGRVEPWDSPPELPGSEHFDAWLVLADGSFALGSSDGQVHLLDPVTRRTTGFQVASGFITDLAPSVEGGILVQTDLGTTHLFWPSQWTRIGSETGLMGRVERIAPWRDHWIVLTNSGVFRSDGYRFHRLDWTAFETWDWLRLDDERALLADSFRIYEVLADQEPRAVSDDIYPRLLLPSARHPGLILVGTELGLVLLRQDEQAAWQPLFAQDGFTGRVLSIVELSDQELLLAIADLGIVRVRLTAALDGIEEWRILEQSDGIDYATRREVYLARLDSDLIVASTAAGLFEWREDQFQATPLLGLDPRLERGTTRRIKATADGSWWAWTDRELWRRPPGGPWRQEDLSALRPISLGSLTWLPDHPIMLGDHAAVLLFDDRIEALEESPVGVVLRRAELTDAMGRVRRLPLDGTPIRLPHDIRSIVFEYALPSYRRPEQRRYRARMIGYEEDFGDWRETTRITYSVFSPGPKRFEVMARDSHGRVSEIRPLEFTILPPWYRTGAAMVLWLLLALSALLLLLGGTVRWRLQRVESDRQRLADMVRERTLELAVANRKLRNMANVDGLTGVANRRRLDQFLEEAWTRCIDRNSDLAVILIDVDHFKQFNDRHGHQAGDHVLKEVANLLTGCLRRGEDVVARYGGEEFMVVMPSASRTQAVEAAERMRSKLETSDLGVTLSLGVASGRPSAAGSVTALVEAADRSLYRAKQLGRNRVCSDDQE
ncbi:MAG: GGDEF domain-containing protein [Wenzhouxiangellaceae bacterium]|nr:MAG: GGDEF domain-containing protein [Wenzhouxiangellaceae bacterium]